MWLKWSSVRARLVTQNSLSMTESEKRWEALGLTKELQGEIKENVAKLFSSECKELPVVKKVYAKTMGDAPKTLMK